MFDKSKDFNKIVSHNNTDYNFLFHLLWSLEILKYTDKKILNTANLRKRGR